MNINLLEKIICIICGRADISVEEKVVYCNNCSIEIAIVVKRDKLDFILDERHDKFSYHGVDPANKFDKSKWSDWRKSNFEFLTRLNLLPLTLDIGSGPGVMHTSLEGVILIDFMNYENVNIITDLNVTIPLSSEIADSIVLSNFLEHIYSAEQIINECHRLLKKDSILYITVPFLMGVHQEPFDFYRYTHHFLTQILNSKGFEIQEFRCSPDNSTFYHLSESYYRFKIANGSFVAKTLWQVQKLIHLVLNKYSQSNHRMDYTTGYMIAARKR